MKLSLLFAVTAISALSQPVFVRGQRGCTSNGFRQRDRHWQNLLFNTSPNRYLLGPTIEVRLPFGLGIEVDALYRHLQCSSVGSAVDVVTNTNTTGDAWEFPVLAKYRILTKALRPYIDGGLAFDTLAGPKQTIVRIVIPTRITTTTATSNRSCTGAGGLAAEEFYRDRLAFRWTPWLWQARPEPIRAASGLSRDDLRLDLCSPAGDGVVDRVAQYVVDNVAVLDEDPRSGCADSPHGR